VQPAFRRIALAVHPTRPIDRALARLKGWTGERGIALVQLANRGEPMRRVAEPAQADAGDLVVAMGGDGTVLTALRAAADAPVPVLGVACGSLGALSAVTGDEIAGALDRVLAGDWTPRSLPALAIAADEGAGDRALNDFVAVRGGAGQVGAAIAVDDEPYVRFTGDGVIVATALGSSAYSMAGGGPVLAAGTPAFVCTPLAMHGGSAPPLVVPADAVLTVEVTPGYGGFVVEIDGFRSPPSAHRYRLTLQADVATLVAFGEARHGLAALRRRRLITDSPRILARDDRAVAPSPIGPVDG
jgi:NAD+ kinase